MELSGDQGFDLLGRGGVDVGERFNARIEGRLVGGCRGVRRASCLRSLAEDKGEPENKLVIVRELQEEAWGRV